jgi:hypothetical protein
MIFVYYAWNEPNTTFIGCSAPNPAVAQVCTRWRAIALKVPDLWNRIHLAQRQFLVGALQRFDWDISVFWGTRERQHWVRQAFGPHAIPADAIPKLGHIREIDFTMWPSNCSQFLAALPLEMPSLETVHITSDRCLQDWFSTVRAPNLKGIILEGNRVDWTLSASRFGNHLVKLCIEPDLFPISEGNRLERPPFSRLLATLRSLVALRHLSLTNHAVTFDIPPHAPVGDNIIIMLNLQSLVVRGPTDYCIALLRNIRPAKLDRFTLRASAAPLIDWDVASHYSCFESLQMMSLWNAANSSLASLDGSSDLTVDLDNDVRITRLDLSTKASLEVEFKCASVPAVLNTSVIHPNIRCLDIRCKAPYVLRFPPSEGDQDVSAAENEFTLRIPSIPSWASFINTATHLEELKLAGDAALKVLLKLALNYLLEPALRKYDYPLPPALWHLKTITFSDMRSPDAIEMITAIVRNLYNRLRDPDEDDRPGNSVNNRCENLDGHSCIPPPVILHDCKAVRDKTALKQKWMEEMPGLELYFIP